MTIQRLTLLLALTALFVTTGCGRRTYISPRELASEESAFTTVTTVGDLKIEAKMVPFEDLERMFESVDNQKEESILRDRYNLVLLNMRNNGDTPYKARVTNGSMPAKSEIMPIFSDPKIDIALLIFTGIPRFERTSSNGLSEQDAAALKSFALFSGSLKKNTVNIAPYSKEVRLVPLTRKIGRIDYNLKLAVGKSNADKLELLTLPV